MSGYRLVIDHLPDVLEALNLILSIAKGKDRIRKKRYKKKVEKLRDLGECGLL